MLSTAWYRVYHTGIAILCCRFEPQMQLRLKFYLKTQVFLMANGRPTIVLRAIVGQIKLFVEYQGPLPESLPGGYFLKYKWNFTKTFSR